MALFDCAINEKCCNVDGGRGICRLFSSPLRGIWQLKSPHPREFAIQGRKKMPMPGVSPGGGRLGPGGMHQGEGHLKWERIHPQFYIPYVYTLLGRAPNVVSRNAMGRLSLNCCWPKKNLAKVTNATIGVKRNKGAIRSKELGPNPRFCASAIILRAVYRIVIYVSDQCIKS